MYTYGNKKKHASGRGAIAQEDFDSTAADGGKMVLVNRTLRTSGRRYEKMGELTATYLHFKIALSWWFGMPQDKFNAMVSRLYQDIR